MECIATKAQKRPAEMDQVITRLELSKHVLTRPAVSPTSTIDDSLSDSNF